MTTELGIRVAQHKRTKDPNSHTACYNITRLVYVETYASISEAIAREKCIKGWLRRRKLELVITTNPTWKDLSADWGNTIELYRDLETGHSVEVQNTGVLRCAQDDGL